MQIFERYSKYCQNLKANTIYRQLPEFYSQEIVTDFSHNDHLGLSHHPEVIRQACDYAETYGTSGRSARLLSSNQSIYNSLETKIAKATKTEAAILFISGYQANMTVLPALLDKTVLGQEPLVFTDKLNHSSLHMGCQLSGIRQIRYRHNDLDHLGVLLDQHNFSIAPKFIITESLFGMDGDQTDLGKLTKLAEKFNAFLYLDEAHATGIVGENGYGLSQEFSKDVDIVMGTFGKSIGGSGAFIACSQKLKDYLINRCSGFIYSTTLSPMIIGAVEKAWDLIPSLDKERQYVFNLAKYLREKLLEKRLNAGCSNAHIVPIILNSSAVVIEVQKKLREKGILVSAIRPPTVPFNTARLRVGINISHTKDHIDLLIENLMQCL